MLYSQVAVQKFALMISACGAVFWGSVTVWQLRQAFSERNFSFKKANLSYISSVIVICLPTEHLGVHENSLKRLPAFQIELEFGSVGFWGEGKTGVPGEKPLGAKERTNNKLNPHMASTPGFEPGPHWWEDSALTTAPSLAPKSEQWELSW